MSNHDGTTVPAMAVDRGCVACIGVFDGVHRGHQALLAVARSRADELSLPLTAVTFDPHPMLVVGHGAAPTSLSSLAQRVELLKAAGADAVDVLAFTPAMAAMEPDTFVREVLVERLHVRDIVVGENFRFGHRAAGTVDTLIAEGQRWGFTATPALLAGEGPVRWSSTHARNLVTNGDVAGAADALGRWYRLDGLVVHGDHRGRDLGYPTANLAWSGDRTIPADGVYAGWLTDDDQRYPAAISVGTNPQFDGQVRRVEAYVLDRDDLDLYGRAVDIEFAHRIRGQERFADVDALVVRMGADVEEARRLVG